MTKVRFQALEDSANRKAHPRDESVKRSELFGKNVFNEDKMRQFMTKEAFNHVKIAIYQGNKIDRKIADQVAEGMKSWALSKGATHYTHWFQTLSWASSENHYASFVILTDSS